MRLQLLSDLHMETEAFDPEPAPDAELLVLAGDIDATWVGLDKFKGWPVPVVSVVRQGDKAYVFVRTLKGFLAQPVTVLNSAGALVQVQGPLKTGQEIAVTSVIALKAAWLGKSGSN